MRRNLAIALFVVAFAVFAWGAIRDEMRVRQFWQTASLPRPIPYPLPFKAYSKEVWAEIVAARTADKAGDYATAAAHYSQALELEPGPNSASVDLLIWRGSEYNSLDDAAAKAFPDFDAAIKDGYPTGPHTDRGFRAFMGRGYAALNLGKYAAAKTDFDAVLKELPNDVPRSSHVLAWRGAAYQGLGDRAHAIGDYKASLALDPNYDYPRKGLEGLGAL